MKQYFSVFFLVIMTLNVTIPFAEQLWGKAMYECSEVGSDDTDEQNKIENEKEKETFSLVDSAHIKTEPSGSGFFRKPSFYINEIPPSERYASLPERPPQA